jgi:phosphoribosyl 1,2-cyclic phosphodiesterase
MGDHGHLSNEDGANALMDVIGNRTKKIYLGHLSLHNNIKELAHLTVSSMMQNHDLAVGHDFEILDTDHEKADPLALI